MVLLRKTSVACALLLAFGASMGWSEAPVSQPSLKHSEVKRLMKTAQTPEEFGRLADYFNQRAKQFEVKSQEDSEELARLREARFRPKSYPVQVTSAQYGLESDQSEAQKCRTLANSYSHSAGISPEKATPSVATP
jgi:hypothetical protein